MAWRSPAATTRSSAPSCVLPRLACFECLGLTIVRLCVQGALVRSVELRVGRSLPAASLEAAVGAVSALPLQEKVEVAIGLLQEHGLLSSVDDATKAELSDSVVGFEHAISCLMAHEGATAAAEVAAWASAAKVKVRPR